MLHFQLNRLYDKMPFIALLSMVVAGVLNGNAQEVIFTAKASSAQIRLQDSVWVHYTIENLDQPKTLGPKSELWVDFEVVGGPYQSNNKSSMSSDSALRLTTLTISYLLKPTKTGKLTIPMAIAEDIKGNTYKSNNVKIEVIYDGSPSNNKRVDRLETGNNMLDSNLFIKIFASKSKVYKREQVIVSYKLYARVPMNVNISKSPSFKDFVQQEFEKPQGKIKPVIETYNDMTYQVFTLKKVALYPVKSGLLKLDTMEASGIMRLVEKTEPGNISLDDSLKNTTYRDVDVSLKSLPHSIEVLPPPPDNLPYYAYTGAVGNFKITGSTDKVTYKVNEVINFELIIQGDGELKLIHPPRLMLPSGLISKNHSVIDSSVIHDVSIHNIKKINYTIFANNPGEYSIPTIKFNYLNPQSGKHEATATKPIRLSIIK